MRDVVIAGIGQTRVGELWDISLRSLAYQAMKAARQDANGLTPDALYVGNYLAIVTSHQSNLGTLLADNAGLTGVEAFTCEAGQASGGAAFQMGFIAVASGYVDAALVVGVEKYTDAIGSEQEAAVALSMDADYEAMVGLTLAGQAGLLMQRYLHQYGAPRSAFGAFPVLAHANAVNNPFAMYRKAIQQETYEKAEPLAEPLNLFDLASYADGAAAVLLTTPEKAKQAGIRHPLVRVRGSAGVIDTLALHDRPDPLAFESARYAVQRACEMGGILPGEVDLFELDDAFSIYAVLGLEAAGFAERGEGWRLGQNGDLRLDGRLPVMTMGGSKGRGNPLGAVGVYQIVEAAQQLRGEAGANQVADARLALTLNLGGPASSAFAHVLERL
ncbi:thiolase C-terminal domain-containing protein [Bellilinea sp.]|uniref:thiolase C-terminal domain-containing protein n=1 Tax=Bellilinea sp. TaxID=2838785 RepID=UPI002ADE6CB9|nr:thiolase domain-containing protein [Bellilinea sp.]